MLHSPSGPLVLCAALLAAPVSAEPVAVRQREGALHGFLALRTLEGELLAGGDLIQSVRGDRTITRLVLSFKDGSLHDESATFSQQRNFRLVEYHLIQKGPAFPHPMDVTLDRGGRVTVRYRDDGEEKVETERMKLDPDVANGLVPILLRNLQADTPEVEFSMVAATPKPRAVKLEIKPEAEDTFTVAGFQRKARRFVIKVEIGGVSGLIAPLVGKQPPDTRLWISRGEGPAFLKSEGPLYVGGPIWRIELAAPHFAQPSPPPPADSH